MNFEKLLTAISSRFISIPTDSLDSEITAALQQVSEHLGLDLCALWQFPEDHPVDFLMTHFYTASDISFPMPIGTEARMAFPWFLEKMLRKEAVILSHLTDAPAAAASDIEFARNLCIRSNATFPLFVGEGAAFGAIGFNCIKAQREWSPETIDNLRVVSQIFSSALNRKFIERGLRESEARLKLAADSANAGLWSWDHKTGIIWATEKTRLLYGFTSDEVITGEKFFKLLHSDDVKRVSLIVGQIFKEGSPFQVEYRIVLPDDSVKWMAVRAQAFLKSSGEPDRMMGVSIDITQQVKNQEDLLQLRLELAHMARVMTIAELSGSLAHEINQPLGAILNYASAAQILMSQSGDNTQQINKILGAIVKDAQRAGDVIRRIRGMVKKEAVKFEPLNLTALIQDLLKLYQSNLIMHKVELLLILEEDHVVVKGDSIRLQQVLANLITNAMESMKESPVRKITIALTVTDQDTAVVSIRDSGTGIDAVQKEQMFNPFVTTKKEGLGFGLSICRSIVEEHGGKIWAENNEGPGATFSFSLAIHKGENP